MIKFTHIDGFHYIIRTLDAMGDHPDITKYHLETPVVFRGTVKLHGTNSGVICTPESLVPQSRNRALSVEEDNYGFAAFVAREEVTKAIRSIEREAREAADLDPAIPLVLFGELIGPGIQKGVATNRLAGRQWVLFGAATRSAVDLSEAEDGNDGSDKQYLDVLPTLGERFAELGLYSVLDVPTWELELDFSDREAVQGKLEQVEQWVDQVEKQCPWGRRFGVEGIGEGIVWTPIAEHFGKSWLYWKAKGEAHKKVKARKVAMDPEVVASIEAFVELAVMESRLEQGVEFLAEMGHPVEMRSTGQFLQWIAKDVQRECRAELAASELEWKHVAKAVNRKALTFFKAKVQAV